MPTDFAFRLSTYLTLALSCVCLGYSEWDILPESGVLAGVVLVLLAVSFRTGTRYELDLQSANRVGLAIGLFAAGWLAYQFINKNSLIYTLPWPASLLPYLGPLLMVLMPAKLFRPKHVGDWWAMQGIALAGVGLASSMAEDEVFGILLGLYAVAAITSLTCFFYRRTAGTLTPIPHTDPGPMPVLPNDRAVRSGRVIWQSLGWLILALGIGLPAFFLTPRSHASKWQYGISSEVGLSSEKLADLNRTGDLAENDAVAFLVRATYPDGRAKDDLNPNQRWRAYGLRYYEGGQWTQLQVAAGRQYDRSLPLLRVGAANVLAPMRDATDFAPPDLGPGQYRLEFTARERSGIPVLSDPVTWVQRKPPPIGSIDVNLVRSWYQSGDGTFRPRPMGMFPTGSTSYIQITRPNPAGNSSGNPDLGPAFELRPRSLPNSGDPGRIVDPMVDPDGPLAPYRAIDLPKLQFWTRDLLERLARSDLSIRAALGRAHTLRKFQIAPEDYEAVARALCTHLAMSGEYQYTLKLRRDDVSVDPVEEFLYRTREGHCQRFASGLALMLRSVGVPTNYVLGFRGCDLEGDGNYVIRQSHAHAWVEVLVVRPVPAGYEANREAGGPPVSVCHWLSLDPTPIGGEDESNRTLTGWLGTARETGAAFFQNFIVGYNRDRREATVATARDWLIRGGWAVVGVLAVIAGILVVRPGRSRRPTRHDQHTRTTGFDWFDRLTRILNERGYPIPEGATPREHALAASVQMTSRPETSSLADIPIAVTRAFYEARYGGLTPTDTILVQFKHDLDRLQVELLTPIELPRPEPETGNQTS